MELKEIYERAYYYTVRLYCEEALKTDGAIHRNKMRKYENEMEEMRKVIYEMEKKGA